MQVVCPGDHVLRLPPAGVVRVGGGLRQAGEDLVAAQAGVLHSQQGRGPTLWVEGRQRRYLPSASDPVVGVILARHADNYDVDVRGPAPAALPVLAFENATRRNRPNLKEGDLVYCRVDATNRDMQSTLSCVDAAGAASGFGPLQGGTLVECSTATARALLARPPPPALGMLGRALQFELAVGANGRVWVQAAATATVVTVCAALRACEDKSAAQAEAAVATLLRGTKRGGSNAPS